MPEITLNIPENSKFHSSLNEIDIAVGEVLLNQMLLADTRDAAGVLDGTNDDKLWDRTRVFQIDELTTEEIMNTSLLRKKINGQSNVDIVFPLLGYKQEDIETVFWGTGNRLRQWEFDIPAENSDFEVNDLVIIKETGTYYGMTATIVDTRTESSVLQASLSISGNTVVEYSTNGKRKSIRWFDVEDLGHTGDKIGTSYKAKSITCKYTAVILCDTRDEAQYLRDKFILRCADAQIWHKYASPTIDGTENQIFTVFGIPNLERYPASEDKLNGAGYIYGISFDVSVWGCLTDAPLPKSYIDTIRMNVHVDGDSRNPRIVIN